jgi:hypothetical protein
MIEKVGKESLKIDAPSRVFGLGFAWLLVVLVLGSLAIVVLGWFFRLVLYVFPRLG